MLERLIISLLLSAGFVFVCWTMMECMIHAPKQMSGMSLRDKIIFYLGRFCQILNHKKDFRHIRMEEEFSNIQLNPTSAESSSITGHGFREIKESGSKSRERRYKMKINM